MKLKILGAAVLAAILYSCGSKQPTVATVPEPPQKEVPPAQPEPMATVMTEELIAGQRSYENNCAKCHGLFKPTDFTKDQWAPILVSMQKKAHLSDAEMIPITNYIYTQL